MMNLMTYCSLIVTVTMSCLKFTDKNKLLGQLADLNGLFVSLPVVICFLAACYLSSLRMKFVLRTLVAIWQKLKFCVEYIEVYIDLSNRSLSV